MVEMTADRLVLVDGGEAVPYDGSIEDYIDFILGRNQPKAEAAAKPAPTAAAKASQLAWAERKELQKKVAKADKDMAKLQARIAEVDVALSEPAKAAPALKGQTMGKLGQMREALEAELAALEAQWLSLIHI